MTTGTREIYLFSSIVGSIEDAIVDAVAFTSSSTRYEITQCLIQDC